MTDFSQERYFSNAEALLSLFLSDTDEIFVVMDRDQNVRVCNTAATTYLEKLFGKEREARSTLSDLTISPEHDMKLKYAHDAVFKGMATEIEEATLIDNLPTIYSYKIRPGKTADGIIVAALLTVSDITKKRAVEDALKESEERLRYALEGSNHAIWDWNIKTGHVLFSPSWKRLLGFEDHEIEDHIQEWEKRIHPDDKQQLQQDLKNHFCSGLPHYENEYRLQTKNKSYKWILGRGRIVEREADGTPLRMIGTHTDITGKVESEAQYRNLFETNPLPTCIYDYDTLQFLAVNKVAEKHYGYSKSEFLQMTILDLQPAEQIPYLTERLQKRDSENGIPYPNWKHKKKNGDLFIAEISSTTTYYAGRKARLLVVNDITAKVAAEAALKQSHERYQYVSKATSDAIYDWDITTNEVNWGEGMTTLFGYQSHEITLGAWEACIHPEDREAVSNSLRNTVYKSGEAFWNMEYRFLKSDGTYRFAVEKGFIVRDKDGKPLRMIGAMQDFTDRKKLEEQLLQKELDKQRVISKATIDAQEQERSEIGKELHDNVNQVLTTTKLYLELARINTALKDELIQKSETNIQYVINEIRQLSRSLMNPSLGDLGLIDSIHDLVESVKATRKLHIVWEAPESIEAALPENLGLTIYRIIQEGLNNAVKHARATTVYLSLARTEFGIRLVIKDDGIGFKKENIKHGTGLKSIQNRVYLTHGTLQIDSAPGNGCTLTIHFKT